MLRTSVISLVELAGSDIAITTDLASGSNAGYLIATERIDRERSPEPAETGSPNDATIRDSSNAGCWPERTWPAVCPQRHIRRARETMNQ